LCAFLVKLAGEKEREEEKKKKGERREKWMLLAFQRDDSTGFTKSPLDTGNSARGGGLFLF